MMSCSFQSELHPAWQHEGLRKSSCVLIAWYLISIFFTIYQSSLLL